MSQITMQCGSNLVCSLWQLAPTSKRLPLQARLGRGASRRRTRRSPVVMRCGYVSPRATPAASSAAAGAAHGVRTHLRGRRASSGTQRVT